MDPCSTPTSCQILWLWHHHLAFSLFYSGHKFKSSLLKESRFGFLRTFLNDLDFGALPRQHEEITRGTTFADPATIPSRNQSQPHVAHKLSLNPSPVNVENAPPMTPKQSGQNGKHSVSPNIKDICQNSEIDTPEKELLIKNRGKQLISKVKALCEGKRESLSTVFVIFVRFWRHWRYRPDQRCNGERSVEERGEESSTRSCWRGNVRPIHWKFASSRLGSSVF